MFEVHRIYISIHLLSSEILTDLSFSNNQLVFVMLSFSLSSANIEQERRISYFLTIFFLSTRQRLQKVTGYSPPISAI